MFVSSSVNVGAGVGLMTGQAAGLEGSGNKDRALSRCGTGFGIAERYWRETGEKQGQGRLVGS